MKQHIIFMAAVIAMFVSLVAVAGIVGFEIYVRWAVNQNFTVLGGAELEVLTASAFALTLGLAYLSRPRN